MKRRDFTAASSGSQTPQQVFDAVTKWNGTDIVFDIARKGGKTELRMTHVGLVPALECFDDCSGGWGFYFSRSLRALITTGKGQPDPKPR